jgi:hypothetical protein
MKEKDKFNTYSPEVLLKMLFLKFNCSPFGTEVVRGYQVNILYQRSIGLSIAYVKDELYDAALNEKGN